MTGPAGTSRRWPPAAFIGGVYVLELCALVAALSLYKRAGRSLPAFLHSPAGSVLVLSVLAGLFAASEAAYAARRGALAARWIAGALALNVTSLAIAFATAEVAIRVLVRDSFAGQSFAGTLLFPRSWERTRALTRATLAEAAAAGSFLVFDRDLGWVPGASRASGVYHVADVRVLAKDSGAATPVQSPEPRRAAARDDSLYVSSVEGIRSPRTDTSFATLPARHRIALIGDSFTFGLEVRYEDSWGRQLERALGPAYHVLNFGVDGYGVDQIYVRYRRDVVPWHPELVILGVINDDLRRTLCVYGFLCFSGGIPFPKPRFVVAGDSLRWINQPLPEIDSLLAATQAITQLPFINADGSYDPEEWARRALDASYVVRYLRSRFRRWSPPRPEVTDAALEDLNGRLLSLLVRSIRASGARPLVLFFPSVTDFLPQWKGRRGVAERVLARNHLPFRDMTPCVQRVDAARRFVIRHYSAAANRAIAACLRDDVLARRAGTAGR